MTATKGFILGAATTPLDTRKAAAERYVASAAGAPRIGVLTENPSIVTSDPSTAPMRLAIAKAGLVTQRSANDGVAEWTNDGSIFVTVTKPGSNSHYVTVYAKHNDASAGDGSDLPEIGVVTGAASATPAEAALPAGALKLATVLIPSTATSTQSANVVITNVYAMTALRGGVVPVRNSTELAAWAPADSGLAYQQDTDVLYGRINGAWRAVSSDDTGWTLCTSQNAGVYTVAAYGDDRALSVRRIGKSIILEGHISSNVGTSPDAVWAFVPAGFRPAKNRRVLIQQEGNGTTIIRGFVRADGGLVIATGIATDTHLLIAGEWFIE